MEIIVLFIVVIVFLASAAKPQDTVEDRASGGMGWLPIVMIVLFGIILLALLIVPAIPE